MQSNVRMTEFRIFEIVKKERSDPNKNIIKVPLGARLFALVVNHFVCLITYTSITSNTQLTYRGSIEL
ncbi:MAG: amino acid permease [Bacillariaceae sp.]|jgi:amino acid permease